MAQLLAPYNNSMRLGQGFNSYTQQTCLDQAVLPDPTFAQSDALRRKAADVIYSPPVNVEKPSSDDTSSDSSGSESKLLDGAQSVSDPGTNADVIERARQEALKDSKKDSNSGLIVPAWVKPQIVTYSSRFVDKLSDVTDAMNISGSLSIKTATIGGKANGSYVDSDKFKSSDINFHLQVKVTNQVVEPGNYCIFNKIPHIHQDRFNEIYGDTFISGWESGGELNAIISMKIADKSKVFEIKASLEAELTTPSVSGAVKGTFEMTKNSITSDTETTIAVNWSGGGRIKDPTEDWSIASLKKAAAAFPDLVAITPQRTYAILTKYTALESFHLQNPDYSPLDYENAGVYTGSLLDNYMDYKSLWKQISFASYELEGNRATIDLAQPSQDVYDLAKVKGPLPPAKRSAQKLLQGSTKGSLAISQQGETTGSSNQTENEESIAVFPASFAGLIQARKLCRMEMAKIVSEVDAVAEDPSVATDVTRDSYFLNPLIFKQLVPIVRSLSAENAVLGVKDPSATVILGYNPPVHETSTLIPVYKFNVPIDKQDYRLQASIRKCAAKAEDYRVHGTAGEVEQVHENAQMFNALETLNATFCPSSIAVWAKDNVVQGIQVTYTKGDKMTFGVCNEKATDTLDLDGKVSEAIVEINIKTGAKDGKKYIAGISFATNACKLLDVFDQASFDETKKTSGVTLETFRYVRGDDQPWTLRGFFGFADNVRLLSLGVVWGKDSFVPTPNSLLPSPLCRNLLGMNQAMQKDVLGHMVRLQNRNKFIMGDFVFTDITSTKPVIFNALTDVESTWTIAKLGFATANSGPGKGRLSGLKVLYTNGRSLKYGAYPEKDEEASWVCDVNSPIVTAKLVTTKPVDGSSFINSVEFILAADNLGQLPGWPLDVGTVRFLSDEGEQSPSDLPTLVESAPKPGKTIWSMKGFYGEHTDELITKLGIVWGRS
ncbi:hypothetical protein N7456_013637 [Penicillium angulare]|uniref:Jacalin-type lectin domain-containing protein n=1 Tax=Penicillium angulare TaxID=116970 RepID=A0A9W9JTL1_9EURO|nr:hypothetical protein N7456_013637 [Penicillium angulare]